MLSKFKTWFLALSVGGKVGVIAAVSIVGIAAASTGTQPAPTCTASVAYSTETQSIAFTNKNVDDGALAQGSTKVTTPGVNGEKQLKHQITTYTPRGCKVDTDVIVSETTTKQPLEQVTAVGTYVAPPTTTQSPTTTTTTPSTTPSIGCYPLTNGRNCYEPGEYCRNSDHGTNGVAGNGENITCTYNNGWRWEPY